MRGTAETEPRREAPSATLAGVVPAPIPHDEEQRLDELRRTGLLDSAAEAAFDAITRAAAALFDTPTALISLVDRDRQWFKSCYGGRGTETAREVSFCAHAILSDDVMVVPDATLDPRFAANPQVVADPHIRFYAGAPLKSPSGHTLGTLCVTDTRPRPDFGEREKALLSHLATSAQGLIEAAAGLKSADETRSLFLSTVSHDLRGRVAAIMGYADLLQRHKNQLDESRKEGFIREIRSSAGQLATLLDDILDLERASIGQLKPNLASDDVGGLVRRVVANHGIDTRRQIHLDLSEAVAPVDTKLLERAIENLIANAEKHTPPEAAIWVRVTSSNDGVEVAVEDEGEGVADGEKEAIFEAFRRGGDAGSRPSGSGLGLHLVRRFVELHSGRVWVQDRAGGGASFRFSLPVARSDDGG